MNNKIPDIKADICADDRGESISLMEPLLIADNSPHRSELNDLAIELAAKSAGFRRSLPNAIQTSLANIMRSMNCYYSNLIEGHNTHPIDIERALQGDYSKDIKKRDLQLEAKAHVKVQQWIDEGRMDEHPYTQAAIREMHRRFYSLLPDNLLWIEDPLTNKKMKVIPGELRTQNVIVGDHIAISPGAVNRFLKRYESVYNSLGKAETILAAAAAHHRLLWIHPFLDGNGRIARLISYASLLNALETGGVWSIARGLARNVNQYKSLLANCDLPRRNDLDGRGHLSEESLVAFTHFFLTTCIDQVKFMESLLQPDHLRIRILQWTNEEIQLGHLPQLSAQLLEAVLYRGELPRGEVAKILNITDRHARRITTQLTNEGILTAEGVKSPFKLAFPVKLAAQWMPRLFPPITP